MIIAALDALKEENGSNKSSVSKYIESKYGDLPAGHSQLLSDHLNRMKHSGELVFWKNNYMKSDLAPPRRGRGRPPKPKAAAGGPLPLPTAPPLSPSRPRGRPPKDPNASHKPLNPKVASSTGRPRGRPRKTAKPTATGGFGGEASVAPAPAPAPASGRRPRGRPPKVKAGSTQVSVET